MLALQPRIPMTATTSPPSQDFEVRLGHLQHLAIQRTLESFSGARRTMLEIDGVRVPVTRLGRGQPLLLIHGFGDRGESMLPLAALLRREFEAVIPDLPGFGDADAVSSDRVTMVAQVRMLAQLLDTVGLPRVHVVGHSMGGGIAARLAHDLPERVLSLTLLSPAGPHGLHPNVEAMLLQGRNLLLPRTQAEFLELFDVSFASRPPFTRSHLRYVGERWMSRREEHARHFDRLFRPQAGEGVPGAMDAIHATARLVYGRDERLVHLDNRHVYAHHLRNGTTVMLDRVGHAPHLEAPGIIAKIVREVALEASRRKG
jgi:abhydrolase domain-containing protein 6